MHSLFRALVLSAIAVPVGAQAPLPKLREVINGTSEIVTYRGVRAVKLIPDPSLLKSDLGVFGILDLPEFKDGIVEMTVVGLPRADAPADSRGFVGVSFRTGPRAAWSEVIYLRPTNARSNDQLRRNHTTQYSAEPDYPWHRLRSESPGVYESYVDLEAGAWTTIKVVVAGTRAQLFVNGAAQPALVINDLKHGDRPGQIALWAHVETDGYFGPVKVSAP